jgi:hypothetical protein
MRPSTGPQIFTGLDLIEKTWAGNDWICRSRCCFATFSLTVQR